MGIKPSDLPGFGTIPGTFIESEESEAGIIIPVVDGNSPLEDLETPDQLEERKKPVKKVAKKKVTRKKKVAKKKVAKKKEALSLDNVMARHPNWEPNIEFQLNMFKSMLQQADQEALSIAKRMNAIECFLEHYPLLASNDELREMRNLLMRNIKVGEEKLILSEYIMRIEHILNPPEPEPEPEKGFFKKLFTRN